MGKSEGSYMFILIIVASIVLLLLVFFIINFILLYQKRQQANFKEKITMKTQFEQELLQTQIEIQEQTLKTISQEIHDNIGQVLSLAKLNLNTVGSMNDTIAQTKIDSTKNLVSKAINDLRDLSRSLHGDKIAEIGLQEAIENELKILQNTGQFKTHLIITGEIYKLDPQKEMVLYRIVQEALHNSVKHAKANNLQVQLNYTPDALTLTISDDGMSFNPETLQSSKTGIGLKNMQNRAVLIGGAFSIHSSKNNGTSISVLVPTNFKPLNP